MPLISVIIPVYNRTEFIGEAIESVLRQTIQDFEIIVVDDGSERDVKKALQPYWHKIKYLYQEHKSVGAARNYAIKESKGKYIAFLDDDDIFEPIKLEIQSSILERNPDIVFVYSDYYIFYNKNILSKKIVLSSCRNISSKDFPQEFFFNYNVHPATILIRRKYLYSIGLLDEDLSPHDDGDLLLRLALVYNVEFSSYPSSLIRIHPNRESHNRIGMLINVLKSSNKIPNEFPDFKKELGNKFPLRIAELNYSLAIEYLKQNKTVKAKMTLRDTAKNVILLLPGIKLILGKGAENKLADFYYIIGNHYLSINEENLAKREFIDNLLQKKKSVAKLCIYLIIYSLFGKNILKQLLKRDVK